MSFNFFLYPCVSHKTENHVKGFMRLKFNIVGKNTSQIMLCTSHCITSRVIRCQVVSLLVMLILMLYIKLCCYFATIKALPSLAISRQFPNTFEICTLSLLSNAVKTPSVSRQTPATSKPVKWLLCQEVINNIIKCF